MLVQHSNGEQANLATGHLLRLQPNMLAKALLELIFESPFCLCP